MKDKLTVSEPSDQLYKPLARLGGFTKQVVSAVTALVSIMNLHTDATTERLHSLILYNHVALNWGMI